MIALLQGKVEFLSGQLVTLNVQGVGYEVFCSAKCLENLVIGDEARIIVYTSVSQDSIRLFGFIDQLEKQVFLLLTQVKGIGPRTGAEIISRVDTRELLRAIGSADVARLQRVKGVGKKTSERIIVELKDKVAEYALGTGGSGLQIDREIINPFDEALQALQALGFGVKDAERALQTAQSQGLFEGANSGKMVKEALRFV